MEFDLIPGDLEARVRVWLAQILCSSLKERFEHASIAVIAGFGVGQGCIAFEHCYSDWGLHVPGIMNAIKVIIQHLIRTRSAGCKQVGSVRLIFVGGIVPPTA